MNIDYFNEKIARKIKKFVKISFVSFKIFYRLYYYKYELYTKENETMKLQYFISKEELLAQLINQVENTGVWWDELDLDEHGNIDFDNLESEYRHLRINSVQKDLMKMHGICMDDFCRDNNINFVSETNNSEIKFIHVTRKINLKSIQDNGLIVDLKSCYIPDLGTGIYVVPIDSRKGIDNLKIFLEDFPDEDILLIEGVYEGDYTYCFKGEGHEGYVVLKNEKICSDNLIFKTMSLSNFLLNY